MALKKIEGKACHKKAFGWLQALGILVKNASKAEVFRGDEKKTG